MSATGRAFTVIHEEPFIDKKEPGKETAMVLVYFRTQDGLVKTAAFRKDKYGLSTRDALIENWVKEHSPSLLK